MTEGGQHDYLGSSGFPPTTGGNDSRACLKTPLPPSQRNLLFAYAEILENAVQDILRAHRTGDFA